MAGAAITFRFMNKLQFILLAALFMLLSGFIFKPVIYVRSTAKVYKMLVLPPVSAIAAIQTGSKMQINKELSQSAFRKVFNQLKKSIPDTVDGVFFNPDSTQQSSITKFVSKIAADINSTHRAKTYTLPDSLRILFKTVQADFIFCVCSNGFTRTAKNMVNIYQATEISSYLSLGIYDVRPLKSSAMMTCFIMDLKHNNLLYFKRDIMPNRDPTDALVIKAQLTALINRFFM